MHSILSCVNEIIGEKLGVAPIVEKIAESCLRWSDHMWRRLVEELGRRIEQMRKVH